MKAVVHVLRIGYAHADVEVEVDDCCLKKNGRKLTPGQIDKMLGKLALEKAGDISFSENDADYHAGPVTVTEG